MYNTVGGDVHYNYAQQPSNMHPLAPSQPIQYDGNNVLNASNQVAVNGYDPLDFGYGMNPTTTTTTTNYNINVNKAPFTGSNTATGDAAADPPPLSLPVIIIEEATIWVAVGPLHTFLWGTNRCRV